MMKDERDQKNEVICVGFVGRKFQSYKKMNGCHVACAYSIKYHLVLSYCIYYINLVETLQPFAFYHHNHKNMTCANCHSPKGPPAAIAGKDYSGGLSWDEPPFTVTAPNITQDKETGVGSWSDADIKKLLTTGQRPNGVQVAEVMPTSFYPILTEGDLNGIVAYMRTIKPVKNKETLLAEARVVDSQRRKRTVSVSVSAGDIEVFKGTLTCHVLDKHVLEV